VYLAAGYDDGGDKGSKKPADDAPEEK